jgi:hypothetical protein
MGNTLKIMRVNTFVTRQTEDSPFSFSTKSWEKLVEEATANFDNAKPGYKDGVILIPLPLDGMFSGVCILEEDGQALHGAYESRRKGETPRKAVRAVGGKKLPAKEAFIVCYSSIALDADKEVDEDGNVVKEGSNELPPEEGNWEFVSLNASPVVGEMPINPMTAMHNHFGSDGGSETGWTAEEFEAQMRESFLFWKDKAMCG